MCRLSNIDVSPFEDRCVALRRSMSRCVDLRRWIYRLSKIDESTFGDGCVDLRRPMIDVSTFEIGDWCVDHRRSIVDVSTFEHRCEIRLLYLLKILILTIAVCELRRGFALQCFHCSSCQCVYVCMCVHSYLPPHNWNHKTEIPMNSSQYRDCFRFCRFS